MAKFANKRLDGKIYDLSHLDDHLIEVTTDGAAIRAKIIFSCHCFTEEFKAHHHESLRYNHQRETRAFCLERYERSHLLRGYFDALAGSSVYHARHMNFFFVRAAGGHYCVFFDVQKARSSKFEVLVNVQSAYVKPNVNTSASPVKFANLLGSTMAGKKPKLGPQQRLKRH